jgi:isochorismate hydrolase
MLVFLMQTSVNWFISKITLIRQSKKKNNLKSKSSNHIILTRYMTHICIFCIHVLMEDEFLLNY